jgi:hypothetical protein
MALKYIISEYSPIIFNETLNHSDVARCLHSKVLSAGFVNIQVRMKSELFSVTAYGKSISLGIESRPEDSKILEEFLTRDPNSFLYGDDN